MPTFNEGEPVAFFITWTCYGTWLPGDQRGYIQWHQGWKPPSQSLELHSKAIMVGNAATLTESLRAIVEATVTRHCEVRGWNLWAVSARSNHVHVVVSAPCHSPTIVRDQLKAWCTRELRKHTADDQSHWWAEGGSGRSLNSDDDVSSAIQYTLEAQDRK